MESVKLYAAEFLLAKVLLRVEVLGHTDQFRALFSFDGEQNSLGCKNLEKLFSQCFITEEIVLKSLQIHDSGLDISEINSRIKFGRSLNCFAAFGSAACLNLAILSEDPV